MHDTDFKVSDYGYVELSARSAALALRLNRRTAQRAFDWLEARTWLRPMLRFGQETQRYLLGDGGHACADVTTTQMEAMDDIPEQPQPARREAECQHRQRGVTPRTQWKATSLSQTKLWLAAGFKCRRTWERHGKPTPKIVAGTVASMSRGRRPLDRQGRRPLDRPSPRWKKVGKGSSD